MKELVSYVEKQLKDGSDDNSAKMYELYQEVKTHLEKIHGYVDLESVFSVVEDITKNITLADLGFTSSFIISKSIELDRISKILNDIDKKLASDLKLKIKALTRSVCQVSDEQDSHIKKVFEELYGTVASKAKQHNTRPLNGREILWEEWPIYTTNYDRVQEIYWEGITELNNLVRKDDRGIERIELDRITEPYLKLVKLHGSLDWYILNDGTIVRSNTNRVRIGGIEVTGEMMLYPLNQKDLYLHPWLELFRGFKEDLLNTQNWLVIGYSFNDLFIRNIFKESLKRSKSKLIVVCPKASEIVQEKFYDVDSVLPIDGKLEESQTISKLGHNISPG